MSACLYICMYSVLYRDKTSYKQIVFLHLVYEVGCMWQELVCCPAYTLTLVKSIMVPQSRYPHL